MLRLLGFVFLLGAANAQYSYSSASAAAAPAASSVSYPSMNLPLIQFPIYVGSGSFGTPSATPAVATTTAATTPSGPTNFLASLPKSPIQPVYTGPTYAYGTYGVYDNDVDPLWKTQYYTNAETDNLTDSFTLTNNAAFQPLNLSSPQQVAVAQYWGPQPDQIAAWSDNVNATTAAAATPAVTKAPATLAPVSGSNLYYAAYPGNTNNIGYSGIGMQVPGPAPMSNVQPGLNYAYATSAAATSAPAPSSAMYSYSSNSVYSNGRR